jgi:hypothetical protein
VDDFSMCLTRLVNNITVLGGKITETEIVKKMLHVVPAPLEQVAILIETLLDLDRLSVEVTGHLRNVKQRKKRDNSDKQGHLLLTEEEWVARYKNWENSNKGGRSSSGDENGDSSKK